VIEDRVGVWCFVFVFVFVFSFGHRRSCDVEDEDLTMYFDGMALVNIGFGWIKQLSKPRIKNLPAAIPVEGPVTPRASQCNKEPPLLNPFFSPCSLAIGSFHINKTNYDPSII
jgi:hypothetical protein